MTNSSLALARELAALRDRLTALERKSQLTHSTVQGADGKPIFVANALRAGVSAKANAEDALLQAMNATASATAANGLATSAAAAASEAMTAAGAAATTADAAAAAAASAATAAAAADAKAGNAMVAYFGATPPGLGAKFGDLWRDTNGVVRQFDGTEWVDVTTEIDPQLLDDVEYALAHIATTEAALDGKVTTYAAPSTNPPTGVDIPLCEGDLWFVTNEGNLLKRYDGSAWVDYEWDGGALRDGAVTSTKISDSAITTPKLAANSVSSAKLETNLVLATRIIAGPVNGKHAEMRPSGFHVYGTDENDNVVEIARLGAEDTDDFLALAKVDGEQTASINAEGALSGSQVNSGSIFYQGTELSTYLDRLPKGIIGWGERVTSHAWQAAGTTRPFLRVDARLEPGRLYRISTSNVVTCISQNNMMIFTLLHKIGEECTTANGTQLMATRAYHDFGHSELCVLYKLPANYTSPQTVSFLLTQLCTSGTAYLRGEDTRPAQIMVEDMGTAALNQNGVATLNASTDRSPLMDYQMLTRPAHYVVVYRDDHKYMYSGTATQNSNGVFNYGHDSQNHEIKLMIIFDDVTADLSGHEINAVRIRIPVQAWTVDSPRSIAVGTHNVTTGPNAPSDIPSVTELAVANNLAAPAERWITLPASTHNGWKTGTVRGVVLQRPASLASASTYFANLAFTTTAAASLQIDYT